MKQAYISLYKKQGIENFAEILEENGWEILASYSTFDYLTQKGINATEIKTSQYHPTLVVISSIALGKKIKPISDIKLVIADIPENLKDEVYNFMLITAALKKNIAVMFPDECMRYADYVKIYGGITEGLKKELNFKKINLISYLISSKIYTEFPYLNERDDILTIPFKKIKEMKGENPHQKAFLYETPFKKEFELIKGDLNTNHFFDIQKALDIISEIEMPFTMMINHSNISAFSWEKDYLIKAEAKTCKTLVLNFKAEFEILQKALTLKPEMIIARDYDSKILSSNEIDIKNLVKITHRIKPPKEMDIFFTCGYTIIQYKDVEEIKTNTLSNIKIQPHILDKIKAGLSIIRHLKTFSAVVFYNKTLVGLSQGNYSSSLALRRALDETTLNIKNVKITQTPDRFTVITDGIISADIIDYISKYLIDVIVSSGLDEISMKKLSEKNIILVVTEKRHYRHI